MRGMRLRLQTSSILHNLLNRTDSYVEFQVPHRRISSKAAHFEYRLLHTIQGCSRRAQDILEKCVTDFHCMYTCIWKKFKLIA
jgi:hypothetical protein